MRLMLASANVHKRRELARLVVGHEIDELPAGLALPPEDGETFAANARAKAHAVATAVGRAVIADDSGIEAAALDGAPGVRSARYAGERATDTENLDKLIREVTPGSALAYVCALAWVDPQAGEERLFQARCTGRMAARARGRRGFGYDPIFVCDDARPEGLTMAELSDAAKDAISHRGKAARLLVDFLSGG